MTHFNTREGTREPLEGIFLQLDFGPLVFGTLAEMSSNVKDFVESAVENEVVHLGMSMAAMTPVVARMVLRRINKAWLSLAAWRGYTKMILDRTKHDGTGVTCTNKA